MVNRNLLIIVYCAIVAFAILYEHQPLLPLLASEWGRPINDMVLLTTFTMLPLAIAPLFYGYILERFSSRHMLMGGFALLFISQSFLSVATNYTTFLVLRSIEGLVLPAIFTSLMTYMSATGGQANSRKNIGFYIAATIVGGYLGRIITGVVTNLSDWQTAFWMWAVFALFALILLTKLDADPRNQYVKLTYKEIKALLRKTHNRIGLLSAFLLMFVFAGMLNYLPFRMIEIDPTVSPGVISFIYTGYLVGVIVSLLSPKLVVYFGNERTTLLAGCGLYVLGATLFMVGSIQLLFLAMFILASGMFALHSVLSGYLNHMEQTRKGMINGLYVSAYYSGGVLGSFVPGYLYQAAGWLAFCGGLIFTLLLLTTLINLLPGRKIKAY